MYRKIKEDNQALALQLRVGNYVHYYRFSDPYRGKLETKPNLLLVATIHTARNIYDAHEKFEPIELTEHWLLAFGFIDGLPWEYESFRLDDEHRLHFVDPTGYASIIAREVIYVHQLQNIIFFLTAKELKVLLPNNL